MIAGDLVDWNKGKYFFFGKLPENDLVFADLHLPFTLSEVCNVV